jgi:outer membrane protein insertion porin family
MTKRVLFLLLPLNLLIRPSPSAGQPPLFLVNSETEVASVDFRFPEGRSVDQGALKRQLALSGPTTGQRVQGVLSVLPGVAKPSRMPFNPPDLLKDVERIRRYFQAAGFDHTEVDYAVTLDTVSNAVDVTFEIREGDPIILRAVRMLQDSTGEDLGRALPPEVQVSFSALRSTMDAEVGRRLSEALQIRLRDRVAAWLANRGFPFPQVTPKPVVEPDSGTVLELWVQKGPRARVRTIEVTGASELPTETLQKLIPLDSGDWYDRDRIQEGQRGLYSLDIVRFAATRVERGSETDSLVDIRIEVQEADPRFLSGRLGYASAGGLSADGSWTHRTPFRGTETLEVSAVAETSIWATDPSSAERYGLSLMLREPVFFSRRLEGWVRPFMEYRDELRDRSIRGGLETGILFRRGPGRTVAVRYALTGRKVLEARPGSPLPSGEDIVALVRTLDTLNLDGRVSTLGLSAEWGRPVDFERSIPGWAAYGDLELATPPTLSSVEYGKVALELSGSLPIGTGRELLLSGRTGVGRVFPFGVSVPAPDGSDQLEVYLKLKDAILTAGGPSDVRGWGREQLGPKIPDFRILERDSTAVRAERYLPLGGLARWTGSLQVEVPLPWVGRPHGLHAFLDAGRVWTPDGRFLPTGEALLPGQNGRTVRFGTGIGISIHTPVGPVQLDLGYKLNPSPLDVRSPQLVAEALMAGGGVEGIPTSPWRRWHLHFSLGEIR